MRILHRFGLRPSSAQRRELTALGVDLGKEIILPGGGDPIVAFDLDEEHPNWVAASSLLRKWDASDIPRTEFTPKEIDAAQWLEITAWHHGYPQPEDSFGYLSGTYDLAAWCESCGIGAKQKAPFRMKGEPRWGRRGVLHLNWVFDELFVTPEVWKQVFDPAGVSQRAVLSLKGAELTSVVQLVINDEVNIACDGLPAERCSRCDRTKYSVVSRGRFPALQDAPNQPMVRTAQYFGSDALAFQRLLVNRSVVRAASKAKLRGWTLTPVADRAPALPVARALK